MRFTQTLSGWRRFGTLGALSLAALPASAQEAPVIPPPPAAVPVPSPAAVRPNPQGAPILITLEDALSLALDENPGVEAVSDRIARARAQVDIVAATVRPQVSATGTYTLQGPISSFTLPDPTGGPPQSVKLGNATSKSLALSARKAFDLSGANGIARDIARRGITSAELELARAQNDLLYSVYNSYYSVLRAEGFVRVQEEALLAAQEQLRVADVQFREGATAQFDVVRAAVQVENIRQQLVTAEKNASLARATLLNALGISPTQPINIAPIALPPPPPVDDLVSRAERAEATDESTPSPPAVAAPEITPPVLNPNTSVAGLITEPDAWVFELPLEYASALAQAYELRPEVDSAANSVRIAEESVDLARRGNRPDAAISGQYLYTPDVAGFSANKLSWSVNANITVPIYQGGLVRAQVRQAESDLGVARATLEQTRQTVALDVRGSLLDLEEALRRRQTAAANVEQAREAYRIAQVRFQAGVSTSVELTDAQVALITAQTNLVNADYDYLGALARLRKAIGRLVPEETRARIQNEPGPPPPALEAVPGTGDRPIQPGEAPPAVDPATLPGDGAHPVIENVQPEEETILPNTEPAPESGPDEAPGSAEKPKQ